MTWSYQGSASAPGESEPPEPGDVPPSGGFDPRGHGVPTMLRDPLDGSLTMVEQRDGTATLHHLDRDGQLEWNVPVPLPCDVCEVTHLARHPSGDLLLSATGQLIDGDYALIAARYDPRTHQTAWVTTRPLSFTPQVPSRSGEIAALGDEHVIAQTFVVGMIEFGALQNVSMAIYRDDGALIELVQVRLDQALPSRPPLLVRPTHDGEITIAVPSGQPGHVFGLVRSFAPPLWLPLSGYSVPVAVDDLGPDRGGHMLEVGHNFDGHHVRLMLQDRAALEFEPRWSATTTFDSVTNGRATLAVGPHGDAYLALRTAQAPAEGVAPLVGLSMARFTTEGELRWQLTMLDPLTDHHDPIALAVDDDDGLLVATVSDDRLRIDRRRQRCECER